MSDIKPILFDLEEEYKSIYFIAKFQDDYQEARIILGKLFIISQVKQAQERERYSHERKGNMG